MSYIEKKAFHQYESLIEKERFLNEMRVIEQINNLFGKAFIKQYIETKRGVWQIERAQNNAFSATLSGLQISKKNDCEWFKKKLLQAGIAINDIHFDIKNNYQMRIINLQLLKLSVNDVNQQAKNSLF
ncbi:MAG: hypothetical protein LEGION0398_MBIBDBAK_00482 [Legionellaceae bacterium]